MNVRVYVVMREIRNKVKFNSSGFTCYYLGYQGY